MYAVRLTRTSVKFTLNSFAKFLCKRSVIQALFIHSLSCVFALYLCKQNQTKTIETLKDSRCLILLLDYSNQSGWSMSARVLL